MVGVAGLGGNVVCSHLPQLPSLPFSLKRMFWKMLLTGELLLCGDDCVFFTLLLVPSLVLSSGVKESSKG